MAERVMEGPYVFAAFSERSLQERDGVHSLIRIIDKVTLHLQHDSPPDTLPAARLTIFATIVPYDHEGEDEITIQAVAPSGLRAKPFRSPRIKLERGARGTHAVFEAELQFPEMGTYWFEFSFEGRVLTRLPLIAERAPT